MERAHHPVVELLWSAVAIRASRRDRDEEKLLYLKTGLAGVDAEAVAVVENYFTGHGITRVSWEVPWRWVAPNQTEGGRGGGTAGAWAGVVVAGECGRRWGDVRGWGEFCGGVAGCWSG